MIGGPIRTSVLIWLWISFAFIFARKVIPTNSFFSCSSLSVLFAAVEASFLNFTLDESLSSINGAIFIQEKLKSMNSLNDAHALVIGIANYENINKLPETVLNDAQDVRDLLVDPDYCGYLPENVTLLKDHEASKTSILRALNNLSGTRYIDSIVLIYVSSHGGRLETGPNKGEYLLPFNTELIRGEDSNFYFQNAISHLELTRALENIKARKVIMFIDCCHASGVAKDSIESVFKHGLSDQYYDKLTSGRGWAIIASSRNTEQSYILNDDRNSLFTKYLLEGLKGGAHSEGGLIKIFQLFEYLQPKVTRDKPAQHPIFKSALEVNFSVARHPGKRSGIDLQDSHDFLYDAYISFADKEPDIAWVWGTLVPTLRKAGLNIAVSGIAEEPGVALVIGIDRAVKCSKRTVVVLSPQYLKDNFGHFTSILAHTQGIKERKARILPVIFEKIDTNEMTGGLEILNFLDLTHPYFGKSNFERLPNLLKEPLPQG